MHPVLFSGHMMDSPDRPIPRFPPEKETAVIYAIRGVLAGLLPGSIGLAGGACGGDIIFHEQCALLNIPTELYLTYPPEKFIEGSVRFAGEEWVHRFRKLVNNTPTRILPDTYHAEEASAYIRTNAWLVDTALKLSPQISLIALWNGKSEAGKEGGTDNMISLVKQHQGSITHVDITSL
jgi:hypothetical protein